MLNVVTNKVENVAMEGFEVSTSGLSLMCTAGNMTIFRSNSKVVKAVDENGDPITYVDETEVEEFNEYPAFTFDAEPDDDFPVIYDVYLLEHEDGSDSIEVERTELGDDQIAHYDGARNIHTLITFMLPPKCQSLDLVSVSVRLIERSEDYA